MKYRDQIIAYFNSVAPGVLVAANELYEKRFSKMSEAAFFKAVERLAKEQFIVRVAKGLYIRPAAGDGGPDGRPADAHPAAQAEFCAAIEPLAADPLQEAVLNYFFGENNNSGMYIGPQLYFKYGISNVLSEEIWLYSNRMAKATANIGQIHVKRVDIALNYDNTRIIEALEILQNYDHIENLNKMRFARYAKQFARGYQDSAAVCVLQQMNYRKSTIAFMKKILDLYKVDHSLSQFLSYASRYKVPPVQRLAR